MEIQTQKVTCPFCKKTSNYKLRKYKTINYCSKCGKKFNVLFRLYNRGKLFWLHICNNKHHQTTIPKRQNF